MISDILFRVGITGSIGSGKTTVSKIFESLGIPVYYADAEAKRILDYPGVVHTVGSAFGNQVISGNGCIDRQKLAQVVFNNDEKLEVLNKIIHPLVKSDFECWLTLQHNHPYILHEAAILLETGFGDLFDSIIVVTAPEKVRFQRVADRDNISVDVIKLRAEKQWPEPDKLKYADFVVINDNKHLIIPQILTIHKEILKLL
ncbi:MAG: dephospho-CoA kinase [Bacteroidales bacterium]